MQLLGGRYRLVERLGVGGMSVVWRAHDQVLGRQVAVKVLSSRYAGDRDSRDRIRIEAQAAALLSHPNVTNVYDYGESINADGVPVPFVVMELLSGSSLAARLAAGPVPWRLAVRICAQVAAALGAAHARGLVHRDVKPGNVMLTASGAKVVDFGIAAVAGEDSDAGPDGTLVGTPAYLAPERLTGGPVEPASDVYALGVLLYRTLSGELPWPASSITEMISSHVSVEPRPLPRIDGLPAEVADLCHRCLAKDPARRPTSREVARTLTLVVGLGVAVRHGLVPPEPPAGDRHADPRAGAGPDVPRPVRPASPMVDAMLAGEALDETVLADPALSAVDPALSGVDPAAGAVTSDTALVPRRRPVRRTGSAGGRRARLLARAGAGLLAFVSLAVVANAVFGLVGGHGDPPAAAAIGDPAAGPGRGRQSCQVRYETRADVAGSFEVELTIVNGGPAALDAWQLSFTFPGDQRVLAARSAVLVSSGAAVVLGDDGTNGELAGGWAVTVGFTGSYRAGNPLPTVFRLNGVGCAYLLIGATGATIAAGAPPAGDAAGPGDVALPEGGTPVPSAVPAEPAEPAPTTEPADGEPTTPAPTGAPGGPQTGARTPPTAPATTGPAIPVPATRTPTPTHQTYR